MTSFLSATRRTVDKATVDDEIPTPGFMFKDVADITFKSLKECQALEDYLLARLKKDSPAIKLKVLRLIKHVVEKGEPSFRRDMQRRIQPIRACITFRGVPDPVHGDAPFLLVQTEAQAVLNALFNQNETQREKIYDFNEQRANTGADDRKSMPGFGSDNTGTDTSFDGFPSDVSFSEPGKRHMAGIGSTDYTPSSKKTSIFDKALNKVGWPASSPNPRPTSIETSNVSPFPNYVSPKRDARHVAPSSFEHVKGVPAGGWNTDVPSNANNNSFSNNNNTTFNNNNTFSNNRGPPRKEYNESSQNVEPEGKYEKKLVDEITAPGGVKTTPPRELVSQFVAKAASLDVEEIADLLNTKLTNDAWQVRFKALCIIEELIHKEFELAEDYFRENIEHLEHQLNSQQKSVKSKALHILNELKPGMYDSQIRQGARTSTGDKLLLFGEESNITGNTTGNTTVMKPSEFSFLEEPVSQSQSVHDNKPASNSSGSMFGGLKMNENQPQQRNNDSFESLFGGGTPAPVNNSIYNTSQTSSVDTQLAGLNLNHSTNTTNTPPPPISVPQMYPQQFVYPYQTPIMYAAPAPTGQVMYAAVPQQMHGYPRPLMISTGGYGYGVPTSQSVYSSAFVSSPNTESEKPAGFGFIGDTSDDKWGFVKEKMKIEKGT